MTSLIIGMTVGGLVDNGLANVLGLETLRHGTNLANYLGIRVFGGDPSQGGKDTGSTKDFNGDDTRNFFYLFKDSEFPLIENNMLFTGYMKRQKPRLHVFSSGRNFVYYNMPAGMPELIKKSLSIVSALVAALICPTLNFRFSRIDSDRLQNDPQYGDIAYRTTQKVEAWRIGVLGSLVTGLNRDWFARAKENPYKIMTGVAQLTCAVALTVFMASTLVAAPHLAIAGALLA